MKIDNNRALYVFLFFFGLIIFFELLNGESSRHAVRLYASLFSFLLILFILVLKKVMSNIDENKLNND